MHAWIEPSGAELKALPLEFEECNGRKQLTPSSSQAVENLARTTDKLTLCISASPPPSSVVTCSSGPDLAARLTSVRISGLINVDVTLAIGRASTILVGGFG